jgi:hypothetical protein
MFAKVAKIAEKEDVIRYKNLVNAGTIYDWISQVAKEDLGIMIDRDEAKKQMLMTMYSSNYFLGQPNANVKRLFKHYYPNVYRVFNEFKTGHKENLPILLQRIESFLIIDKISRMNHNGRPLFTIHDSLLSLPMDLEYFYEILHNILTTNIGVKPSLRIKEINKTVLG